MANFKDTLHSILQRHIDAAVSESVAAYRRSLSAGLDGIAAAKPAAKSNGAPHAPAATRARRKRRYRSSTDIAVTIDKVLTFITSHPGLRSEEIFKAIGGNKAGVKDALARLRALKGVKTRGAKRAMTYSA